jgi:hypothetical protein
MKGPDKKNYSTKKTLINLWEWYSIILKSDLSALWIPDGSFLKWDKVIIEKLKINEDSPHRVKLSIHREWKKTNKIEMSWWVFMKNFISHINQNDVIEKHQEKNKKDVESILKK